METHRKITIRQLKEIERLYTEGKTPKQISETVKIKLTTVYERLKGRRRHRQAKNIPAPKGIFNPHERDWFIGPSEWD